jgi:hypothetical protein
MRVKEHHSPVAANRLLKTAGGRTSTRGFLPAMKLWSTGDAAPGSQRPPLTLRGSRRRLKRIKIRGNSSLELWLLVGWLAFLVLIVLPWMMRHSG